MTVHSTVLRTLKIPCRWVVVNFEKNPQSFLNTALYLEIDEDDIHEHVGLVLVHLLHQADVLNLNFGLHVKKAFFGDLSTDYFVCP